MDSLEEFGEFVTANGGELPQMIHQTGAFFPWEEDVQLPSIVHVKAFRDQLDDQELQILNDWADRMTADYVSRHGAQGIYDANYIVIHLVNNRWVVHRKTWGYMKWDRAHVGFTDRVLELEYLLKYFEKDLKEILE